MRRQLSAEERALWRRVTADVTRPGGDAVEQPPLAARVSSPSTPRKPAVESARPALRSVGIGATLDARWDRQLRGGELSPDRIVDLHGCTLQVAHARAVRAVEAAWHDGARLLVLVTGKAPPTSVSRIDMPLRGIIRASIGDWLAAHPVAAHIAAIRTAHPRHGGNGALYVVLRRAR